MDDYKIQGIKVNYYFICKRKLWLYGKGITMEQDSDRVLQGKILHENTYKREKNKEVMIDNLLKLDSIDDTYIKEVKISSKMEKADKMQLYYYMYYLKKKGIYKKGRINYVKEKKIEDLELTSEIEIEIEDVLNKIVEIENREKPPILEEYSYCKKCAYYIFCYVKE